MILIAMGSNLAGPWGTPAETLARAVRELERLRIEVVGVSGFYATAGIGPGAASVYINAVLAARSPRSPETMLAILKRIERRAGRRMGRRWGPRTLDLDILDYKGLLRGRAGGEMPGRPAPLRFLVLPHPHLHLRPFVLRPLLDVAPRWRHPRLKRSAGELWARVSAISGGRVLQRVAPPRGRQVARWGG